MKSTILLLLLVLVVICLNTKKQSSQAAVYLKAKYRKDTENMTEAVKKFIGKKCLIYMLSGGQMVGTILEVTDHAMIMEDQSGQQLINLDFVVRVKEFPKNKNGKPKAIVWG